MAPEGMPTAMGGVIKRRPAQMPARLPQTTLGAKTKNERPIPTREQQLDIVRWWRENRSIAWKPSENGGRITISEDDRQLYHRKKIEHSAGNKHEASGYLEYVILEAYATDGALKGRYDVANGDVVPFDPCDIDDKTIGADSLLLYLDQENEREGALVVVDGTLDPVEHAYKLARGLQRTASGDIANAYWYDVESDEPGSTYDLPKEGKIPVINTSVYMPGELMERYVDSRTTAAEGDQLLKRMAAIIAHQQSWELELHARLLTKSLTLDRGAQFMKEHVVGMKRGDLLNELQRLSDTAENPLKAEVARILKITLPVAWEAEEKHPILDAQGKRLAESLESSQRIARLRG